MQVSEVTRTNDPTAEAGAHYLVRADGGETFDLSFREDLLDLWRQQLARSSTVLDLDSIAATLASRIAVLAPLPEELLQGVVVTLDNAAATPIAAEENLRTSGIGPFLRRG